MAADAAATQKAPGGAGRRFFYAYTGRVTGLQEQELLIPTAHGVTLRGRFHDAGTHGVAIYVHGFRSDARGNKVMQLAAHAAARGYSFVRFDLGGHGRTGGDFAAFRLSRAFAELTAVLTHFAARPVVLIGSSMGAWLSVVAATQRPQHIRGLLLLAPGFNFIQRNFAQLPAAELAAWQRAGTRWFRARYGEGDYPLHYDAIADAAAFDVLTPVPTLACSCVIIHGDADEAVPIDISRDFIAHLHAPAKELITVAGGDHRLQDAMPLILTQLDRLWQGAFGAR